LAVGLADALAAADVPAIVPTVGPLVGLHLSATPAVDYDTARTTDEELYARLFHALLHEGVALAPGAYEVAFPGLAHDDSILDQITSAAHRAALTLAPPEV
jgi:glutamate-1-semialdehyde 2,1-aminomutase